MKQINAIKFKRLKPEEDNIFGEINWLPMLFPIRANQHHSASKRRHRHQPAARKNPTCSRFVVKWHEPSRAFDRSARRLDIWCDPWSQRGCQSKPERGNIRERRVMNILARESTNLQPLGMRGQSSADETSQNTLMQKCSGFRV